MLSELLMFMYAIIVIAAAIVYIIAKERMLRKIKKDRDKIVNGK